MSALNRQQFWHLTDNPRFEPDPSYVPEDNALSIYERNEPGLFLTNSPERWVNGHGYVRPYAAQISVPEGATRDERWGGEKFLPSSKFNEAKVERVIPLDAHAREEYGAPGWIEDRLGTTFDTGEAIKTPGFNATMDEVYPFRGYQYDGPDAREMTDEQTQHHASRWKAFLGEDT